jgi:hypothetical protein
MPNFDAIALNVQQQELICSEHTLPNFFVEENVSEELKQRCTLSWLQKCW